MSRGHWDAPAIAKELECSERTVYRDLQTLTTAGVPWFFDEECNSYRVRAGFSFPGLEPRREDSPVEPQDSDRQQCSRPDISTLHLARQSLAAARRLMTDAGELVSLLDRLEAALASVDLEQVAKGPDLPTREE
jgi:hypothetical protein